MTEIRARVPSNRDRLDYSVVLNHMKHIQKYLFYFYLHYRKLELDISESPNIGKIIRPLLALLEVINPN